MVRALFYFGLLLLVAVRPEALTLLQLALMMMSYNAAD